MSNKKVTIDDFNLATADRHEMRFYAKEVLGLNLHHSLGEEKMRARISEAIEEQGVDAPKAEVGENIAPETKRVLINIAKTSEYDGAEPAFVGYQGKAFTIPRGIDVAVPAPLVEILRNAKKDIITQDDEGNLHTEVVQTYPFQIVQEVA